MICTRPSFAIRSLCALALAAYVVVCGERVSLKDCRARPAAHLQCVLPCITFMPGQWTPVSQDP